MVNGPQVSLGLQLARQLKIVLDEEFDALSGDDLPRFEKLGEAKSELILHLDGITRQSKIHEDDGWTEFHSEMLTCKTLHRRNETLLRAKLDTIKAALKLLQQSAESDSATELYDRLGRVAYTSKPGRLADA